MKITMKAIKQWLAFILTALVVITLFGLIFIKTKLVQPSPSFFMELGIVLLLSVLMKIWWYDYTEERRLSEDDIKQEKDKYFTILDEAVQDVNDLDKYLVEKIPFEKFNITEENLVGLEHYLTQIF